MKTLNGSLAALGVATVLAAMPAWACEAKPPATGAQHPAEALPNRTNQEFPAPGAVFEGQVAAVDRATGRLLVDTDFGLLHLRAEPAELEGVEEGDVIEVALVE